MKSATFWLGVIVLAAFESTAALGAEPFAQGKALNDLRWELRFNFPKCRHEGHARDAWCQKEDIRNAANDAGVEEKLMSWASHEKTRSIQMAYFSFSNQPVREALCEAAERGVAVTLYIDQSNEKHRNVQAPSTIARGSSVPPRTRRSYRRAKDRSAHAVPICCT